MVAKGSIMIARGRVQPQAYWLWRRIPPNFEGGRLVYSWTPSFESEPGGWMTVLPLWLPLVLSAIPTVILWRLNRRRGPGCCQKCGYDLRGNISGICPECGQAATKEPQ